MYLYVLYIHSIKLPSDSCLFFSFATGHCQSTMIPMRGPGTTRPGRRQPEKFVRRNFAVEAGRGPGESWIAYHFPWKITHDHHTISYYIILSFKCGYGNLWTAVFWWSSLPAPWRIWCSRCCSHGLWCLPLGNSVNWRKWKRASGGKVLVTTT